MKASTRHSGLHSNRAVTLIEVLVIIAVCVLVASAVLLALAKPRVRASKLNCTNNLKQIGLAYRTWSLDNEDRYPMHVSVTNFGTMELVATGAVFTHFLAMSNELSTPRILCCPNDAARRFVTAFTNLTDTNISYFVNVDAAETSPLCILGGDRNLTNQPPPGSRFVNISGTMKLGWTKALHNRQGHLLFADGSLSGYPNGITMTNTVNGHLAIP